ncbi:MAG: hypothetical protein IT320_11445 [Anaerolineae bacterium]|nr:hypothetical protein [Anaerolineae bacterium]
MDERLSAVDNGHLLLCGQLGGVVYFSLLVTLITYGARTFHRGELIARL